MNHKNIVLCGIVLALTFGVGYLVGADHERAVKVLVAPKAECITPAQIKKLYYTYGEQARKIGGKMNVLQCPREGLK